MFGTNLIPVLIAGLAGAAMATQGKLNSQLSKTTGLAGATFIVHLLATTILAVIVLAIGVDRNELGEIRNARWYTLLGGPLSILIIYAVSYSLSKVSTATGTTGIIVCQILTATIIDHLGILGAERIPFTVLKGLAIILIAIGARILLAR